MKQTLLILIASLAVAQAKAQAPYPDCTNLLVDSVYISGSDLRVVLSNTCSNCASGINGAIYLEMAVVRRSDPTDTFSSTDCYCQMTPYNNSSLAYTMPAPVVPLPALSDIRVVLNSLCFDIPFRTVTGLNTIESITPGVLTERGTGIIHIVNAAGASYRIFDGMGKPMFGGVIKGDKFRVSLLSQTIGLYYIELTKGRTRTVEKIVVQ